MSLDLSGLATFAGRTGRGATSSTASGEPLLLALDKVAEDPNQPRRSFDAGAMEDLTASIKARGVKTPISVRTDPDAEGRYIINHGARRYRAATAAGLDTIPAFVDDEHGAIDQLAENIQREALMLPEIIDGIASLLDTGQKQTEVARTLGKSKAWVGKYAALRALPAPLRNLIDDGQCRDVEAVTLLHRAWKADATGVQTWLGEQDGGVARAQAEALLAAVTHSAPAATSNHHETEASHQPHDEIPSADLATSTEPTADNDPATTPQDVTSKSNQMPDGARPHEPRPQFRVLVGERPGVVLLDPIPPYGKARVKYADGTVAEVAAGEITLVAVVDAAQGHCDD